jgi:hypothetical protein
MIAEIANMSMRAICLAVYIGLVSADFRGLGHIKARAARTNAARDQAFIDAVSDRHGE